MVGVSSPRADVAEVKATSSSKRPANVVCALAAEAPRAVRSCAPLPRRTAEPHHFTDRNFRHSGPALVLGAAMKRDM